MQNIIMKTYVKHSKSCWRMNFRNVCGIFLSQKLFFWKKLFSKFKSFLSYLCYYYMFFFFPQRDFFLKYLHHKKIFWFVCGVTIISDVKAVSNISQALKKWLGISIKLGKLDFWPFSVSFKSSTKWCKWRCTKLT